jgi:hypothetical protein
MRFNPVRDAERVLAEARWIEVNHMPGDDALCSRCRASWPCPYRVVADYALAHLGDTQ